jgi:hypothetical protein
MKAAPPRWMEALIALLIPPACREHVTGDLHQRYRSAGQYLMDAIRAVPLVIVSRIRRTIDPQLLLMEAFALYLSFVGAAWWMDVPLLSDEWGLLRLAVPATVALYALVVAGAYASPGGRSVVKPMAQSAFALACAFFSQSVLVSIDGQFALPWKIMLYGAGASLILLSGLRMLFTAPEIGPRGGA